RGLYERGDFPAALAAFERAIALAPAGAIPRYDAAAALFQLRRHDEAAARYREARELADAGLRTKVDFGLGNAAVARGDPVGALRHYDACLASRVPGPAFDAVRRDAAINRRFAAQLARRPPDEPEEGEGRPRADRERAATTQSDAGRTPSASPESVAPAPAGVAPAAARPGARRTGGAGGTQAAPAGGTPEARLAAALERVREARRLRLPDVPPPASDDQIKDW
ncbi:MAG TPA: magnesium chelatase, partial [Isosphaeraceae bacterium]